MADIVVFLGEAPSNVSDLMINRSWNHTLIDHLFEASSAAAIKLIPISRRGRQDRVIWFPEGGGNFKVSSCYKLIYAKKREIVVPYDESLVSLRKKIWFSNIPGKVKIHWWKICNRILPTVVQLQQRGSLVQGGCVLCLDPTESLEHVCCNCTYMKQVLSASTLLHGKIPDSTDLDVIDWLKVCVSSLSKQEFQMLLILVWAVWKERNQRVWNAKFSPPTEVEFQSKLYIDAFVSARAGKHRVPNTRSNAIVSWSRPPIGWLKVNCDGAFQYPLKNGAWAFIIRDDEGNVVGGGGGFIPYARTAIDTEAKAVLEACSYIQTHSLSPVLIETDCSRLVEELDTEIGTGDVLLEDMHDLLNESPGVTLSFVPRKANVAAHVLVQEFYKTKSHCTWIGEMPSSIHISLPP